MSYHTYTTDAIVCGSRDRNTADKTYQLFTRELGMLHATARSVREERSRQRYALQDFAHVRVSLVYGRGGWRIGSVLALGHPFLASELRIARAVVLHVVRHIRQYVQGEVAHPRIFDDAITLLTRAGQTTGEGEFGELSDIFLLRMLYDLGYIAPTHPSIKALVYPTTFPVSAESLTREVQHVIAQAHGVSHLSQ